MERDLQLAARYLYQQKDHLIFFFRRSKDPHASIVVISIIVADIEHKEFSTWTKIDINV